MMMNDEPGVPSAFFVGDEPERLERERAAEAQREHAEVGAARLVVEDRPAAGDELGVDLHGDAERRADRQAGVEEAQVVRLGRLARVEHEAEAEAVEAEVHRAGGDAERGIGLDDEQVVVAARHRRRPRQAQGHLEDGERSVATPQRDRGRDQLAADRAVTGERRVLHAGAARAGRGQAVLADQPAAAGVAERDAERQAQRRAAEQLADEAVVVVSRR